MVQAVDSHDTLNWSSKVVLIVTVGVAVTVAVGLYILGTIAVHAVPTPPAPGVEGTAYCERLASSAADLSVYHTRFGWLATLLVMVGSAFGVASVPSAAGRTLAMAGVTAVAALALVSFRRADAAGELAVAATEAGRLAGDEVALSGTATCTRAWSAWIKSRTDSNSIARASLDETLHGVRRLKEQAHAEKDAAQVDVANTKAAAKDYKVAIDTQLDKLQVLIATTPSALPSSAASTLQEVKATLDQSSVNAAAGLGETSAPLTIVIGAKGARKEDACRRAETLRKLGHSTRVYSSVALGWFVSVAIPASKDPMTFIPELRADLAEKTTMFAREPDAGWRIGKCL